MARHSRATRTLVSLARVDPDQLELVIADNGTGFDPVTVGRLGHQGLANIRERAAEIGATIALDSGRDGGTRLAVRFGEASAQESAQGSALGGHHARR